MFQRIPLPEGKALTVKDFSWWNYKSIQREKKKKERSKHQGIISDHESSQVSKNKADPQPTWQHDWFLSRIFQSSLLKDLSALWPFIVVPFLRIEGWLELNGTWVRGAKCFLKCRNFCGKLWNLVVCGWGRGIFETISSSHCPSNHSYLWRLTAWLLILGDLWDKLFNFFVPQLPHR